MNSSNTIEPRLIALLNDTPPVFDALPIPELPVHKSCFSSTSFPPLLLDPASRKLEPTSLLNPIDTYISNTIDDERPFQNGMNRSSNTKIKCLAENSSRQSLSKILDDCDNRNLNRTEKRNLVESNKDEFLQLPQPTKKQKNTKQVVPPIIIGLFQPPPQATLFPPIASSCFHDIRGRNSLNTIPPRTKLPKKTADDYHEHVIEGYTTVSEGVKKQRNVAARKKWTEEETNNLLLGVHKHGVGCWSDILSDSCFVFNGRSPIDLKDRWRTCCPDELRKRVSKGVGNMELGMDFKERPSCNSDKVPMQDESKLSGSDLMPNTYIVNRKKRSHRKKLEDLFQLGIEGPLRQSSRRERRQFTKEEDCALFEGYNRFGPAWSKIQKDPRLNLQSRQPTDLRDRFRNKFKDKFREDKGKTVLCVDQKTDQVNNFTVDLSEKDIHLRSNQVSAKKNTTKVAKSMLQSIPTRDGLRIQEIITSKPLNTLVDQPSIDSIENLSFSQFSDWSHSTATPFPNIIGEMDISRLLLDETWSNVPQVKDKQISPEVNNLLMNNSETLHQLPSFFSIPNEADDLNVEPFG